MDKITKEEFKVAYSDLFTEIWGEALAAGLSDGITKGKIEGAEAERKRIKDVEDQLIPGHEALIESLKYDGKTTGPEAAVKILNAEKKIRADMVGKISADSIKPVAQPNPPVGGDGVDPNLPVEERAKQKWDKSPDIREEFHDNLSAYVSFLRQSEAGNVRILKK